MILPIIKSCMTPSQGITREWKCKLDIYIPYNLVVMQLLTLIPPLTHTPRPIERRLVSVFHETEMKIWAGQIFLAAHTVLPN